MVYVFIEMFKGIFEDVRVTKSESTCDQWEQDWLHKHGFISIQLYRVHADQGFPSDTYHIFKTDLEV